MLASDYPDIGISGAAFASPQESAKMDNQTGKPQQAGADQPRNAVHELNAVGEKFINEIWQELQKTANDSFSKIRDNTDLSSLRKALDALTPPPPEKGKHDWTIAINFTTDFGDGQGVESGMAKLKDFAEKTKGTKLCIVAQAAILRDESEKETETDSDYKLERYVIKDGTIKQISTEDSQGYERDLQDLISYANKNEPSAKTGLIIDSHGTGNEGLIGDTGKLSVNDFVKVVQEGLKGSGHAKLDMLDFDACLMAQDGAINKVRKVADQVVASAETESIYDGQNYLEPIARLAKKDSDGLALARDIVTQTHKDMESYKKAGYEPTIETLAHLNLRQYDDFNKSLDNFGEQLIVALKDSQNKSKIEESIDSSQKYGHGSALLSSLFGPKLAGKHRVDLRDFTEKVIAAIDNGELHDPDRNLKRAAQEVLSKRSVIVDSYHGEGDFARAGGLSVFLPGRNLRNLEKESALQTTAGRLCDMTAQNKFNHATDDDSTRDKFIEAVKTEIEATRPHWFIFGTRGVDNELKELESALQKFENAKETKAQKSTFDELHQAAVKLAETNAFKAQCQFHYKDLSEKAAKVYKVNDVDDSTGWSRFRLKLRDGK